MKIACIVNEDAAGAAVLAPQLQCALQGLKADIVPLEWAGGKLSAQDTVALSLCDAAVVLGGDGTIMHVAKCAAAFDVPVLGINGGNMGFLAGLEAHQLDRLSRLVTGEYAIQPRMMLDVTLQSPSAQLHFTALNEAVVSRGCVSRLVQLEVFNEEHPVVTYRADGVIVATPTGSTAYSLSAGGPVVDPSLNCLLLTPVCPHAMHTRPYLFSQDAVLSVVAKGEAYLTVDGEQALPLTAADTVILRRHKKTAKLITLKEEDAFYDILTQKLIERR